MKFTQILIMQFPQAYKKFGCVTFFLFLVKTILCIFEHIYILLLSFYTIVIFKNYYYFFVSNLDKITWV